jgi:hypothetical protein
MRRFLVHTLTIKNVNVVQPEAGVEELPPNVANEFNSNEILRLKLCPDSVIFLAPPMPGLGLIVFLFEKIKFKYHFRHCI